MIQLHLKTRYAEYADIDIQLIYTENYVKKTKSVTISQVSLEWNTKEEFPIYDIINRRLVIPKEVTLAEELSN